MHMEQRYKETVRETERKGKETEIHKEKEKKPFRPKEPSGFSVLPKILGVRMCCIRP